MSDPRGAEPAATLTIGVFDGVHLGHRALLARTLESARRRGGPAVAVTFDPHPAAILAPGRMPRLLTTTGEKVDRIRAAGIDRVVVLPFDREVAALLPEEFIDRHLSPGGPPAELVIGHDFALGRGRIGDADYLGRIGAVKGFTVTRLAVVRSGGEVVSSSRIRQLLGAGDLDRAAVLLDRPYSLRGRVVPGAGRGRGLGFPTANLDIPADKLMPPFGVYAVRAALHPGGVEQPAVMNWGVRPTFEGGLPSAEVHLLEGPAELAGRTLEVAFAAHIRGERRFSGPEELSAQIGADVRRARELLR